jgi:hypothetical protein
MSFEQRAGLLQPCRVVPQLGGIVGFVPGPIRGHNSFHLQSCEGLRFQYLAYGPRVVGYVVFGQICEVLRAIHVIEVVDPGGLIGVVHVRVKEFCGGHTGFFLGGISIAWDKDECVVTAHRAGFMLILKLTCYSQDSSISTLPLASIYATSSYLHR